MPQVGERNFQQNTQFFSRSQQRAEWEAKINRYAKRANQVSQKIE